MDSPAFVAALMLSSILSRHRLANISNASSDSWWSLSMLEMAMSTSYRYHEYDQKQNDWMKKWNLLHISFSKSRVNLNWQAMLRNAILKDMSESLKKKVNLCF